MTGVLIIECDLDEAHGRPRARVDLDSSLTARHLAHLVAMAIRTAEDQGESLAEAMAGSGSPGEALAFRREVRRYLRELRRDGGTACPFQRTTLRDASAEDGR